MLRFVGSLLLGNTLVIKNGKLYSVPIKGKKSTTQGADASMLLFLAFYDAIAVKLEELRLGIDVYLKLEVKAFYELHESNESEEDEYLKDLDDIKMKNLDVKVVYMSSWNYFRK